MADCPCHIYEALIDRLRADAHAALSRALLAEAEARDLAQPRPQG